MFFSLVIKIYYYYYLLLLLIEILLRKCMIVGADRPDPPRFPAADNIGVDSLALSWKAPVWDGGSDITNYLVEKREHPMTSWIRVGNTRYLLCSLNVPGFSIYIM
jgi:hypothetical protein